MGERWITKHTSTYWHWVGTAKMAPSSDPLGVVDQHLRVRGVEGLRVADASKMPNANPQAMATIIGYHGADKVLETPLSINDDGDLREFHNFSQVQEGQSPPFCREGFTYYPTDVQCVDWLPIW